MEKTHDSSQLESHQIHSAISFWARTMVLLVTSDVLNFVPVPNSQMVDDGEGTWHLHVTSQGRLPATLCPNRPSYWPCQVTSFPGTPTQVAPVHGENVVESLEILRCYPSGNRGESDASSLGSSSHAGICRVALVGSKSRGGERGRQRW